MTLYSYYSGSQGYYYTYTNTGNGYMYTYFIDSAKTKPWYVYQYNYNPFWYQYFENLTNPPQTVTVQLINSLASGPGTGFGSSHPGAMNMSLCDGSVRDWTYGATGLGVVIGINDGKISIFPD
jgi:prepilin-type processing-associated H-X9-DG protein